MLSSAIHPRLPPAMADDCLPSHPPRNDRILTYESLSRADWLRAPQIFNRYTSDNDGVDDFCDEEPLEVDRYVFPSDNHLFTRFPATQPHQQLASERPAMMSFNPATEGPRRNPAAEGRRDAARRNRPLHGSNSSQAGPLKLINTGPIISHSGPLKSSAKGGGLSIIPADVVGKKKTSYDGQEPTSPEVTCLGRVKIKHRDYKEAEKLAHELARSFKDQKKKKDKDDEKKQKKKLKKKDVPKYLATEHPKRTFADLYEEEATAAGVQLGMDLSHLDSPETPEHTMRERGAMLAKFMESLLHQQSCRFEEKSPDYVPQVPPANSLLLMRGTSRNWEDFMVEADDETDDMSGEGSSPDQLFPLAGTNETTMARSQVSLSQTLLPESRLWQRRGVAKVSALDIRRPFKLEIQKPTTR